MVDYASASGSAMRSRSNVRNRSVGNSANNIFPELDSSMIDGNDNQDRGNSFRSCWQSCCGKYRSSNNRSRATESYHGLFCGCYAKEESRPKWLALFYSFTRSKIWVVLFYFFSIFQMFGPAIQCLIDTGPRGDLIFLFVRTMMLLFFIVDMIVRCLVDEDYFVFTLCRKTGDNRNPGSTLSRSITKYRDPVKAIFCIGSFLFWCDFLSTSSILCDLSFINNYHFHPQRFEIKLIGGVLDPTSSSGYVFNRFSLNSFEGNLLVIVLRTARCARLVQSRAAEHAYERFSLYGFWRSLKSCFAVNLPVTTFRKHRQSLNQNGDDGDSCVLPSGTTADDKHRQSNTNILSSDHTEADQEGHEESSQSLREKGKFPFTGSDEKLSRRHEAAIKIQRTWRDCVQCEPDDKRELFTFSDQLAPSNRSNILKRSTSTSFTENNVSSRRSSEGIAPRSRFQSEAGKTHNQSQVRRDMRQSTGKRVAIGTFLILFFTVLFTYTERNTTQIQIMVLLHTQTRTPAYVDRSLSAAVGSSPLTLYEYRPAVGSTTYYPRSDFNGMDLKPRNKVHITVTEITWDEGSSIGSFDNSKSVQKEALIDLVATIFVIFFWFAGVVSFSGPVAMLVITPVEQMVRLLGMLTLNPLGYQSTPMYRKFLVDENLRGEKTGWPSDVLKGMETSFLQSTILRTGSLMKVGFGSAGVEIIQNNLETGQNKNMLMLNSQGTTVSCIFLFCDIRQFTDATEQLQEEVFVFTNKIAAVVHSICSSYGGAANKNVGDAFLLSWSLDKNGRSTETSPLRAKSNQADKALLSVVKICISLACDHFFLEPLSRAATGRLKTKLKDRSGPIVQMGFGLHAGKAVQGAIGSQRKIDSTYVSESVEKAEFLESSTKKYKLNMLMSGEFHRLLHSRNRDRCRKIDQVSIVDDGNEHGNEQVKVMDLFTFDMDVNALRHPALPNTETMEHGKKKRQSIRNWRKGYGQKKSLDGHDILAFSSKSSTKDSIQRYRNQLNFEQVREVDTGNEVRKPPELILPNGPALYSQNVWSSPEVKKIREKYDENPYFFETYRAGLEAFHRQQWKVAKKHFLNMLESFDDGPSQYFLSRIDENYNSSGIAEKLWFHFSSKFT